MFELKKIIGALIMPLPFMLILGFLGLFLIMFTYRRSLGCILTFISLTGIFLFSFQPLSSSLLKSTERVYKPFLPIDRTLDYVMVLGSGHVIDNNVPPTSELSRNGLIRLAEGIRVFRLYPGAKLILSGYAAGSSISNARMMANVAVSLGVSKSDIILLENAQDTRDEAQKTASFIGNKSMVLVTSASHMKRAMQEFHKAGLDPIPAPTNFLVLDNIEQAWDKYLPQAKYLEQSERYWYELIGRWWLAIYDTLFKTESNSENKNESTINFSPAS